MTKTKKTPPKVHGFHEKLNSVKDLEPHVINILKEQFTGFENIIAAPYEKGGADSKCSECGKYLAEIKIDFTEYPNHFVERYSNYLMKKDGGPYQYSFVKYYVYYYTKSNNIHIFETKRLIAFLDSIDQCDKLFGKKVYQKGANYTTFGYAMPKVILNHLEVTDSLRRKPLNNPT